MKKHAFRVSTMLNLFVMLTVVMMGLPASPHWAGAPVSHRTRPNLDQPAQAGVGEAYGQLPLCFEANRGQTDPQVKFLSRGAGRTLFLCPTEMVLAMTERTGPGETQPLQDEDPAGPPVGASSHRPLAASNSHTAALRMKFANANPSPKIVGLDELPGKLNHFIGDDPEKWRSSIPTYAKVKYEDVYPGVDLIYYGSQQQLEYDFVVAPGGDPNAIKLRFEGSEELEVDDAGNLILHVSGGEVIQHAPKIYQEIGGVRQPIGGRYVIEADENPQSAIRNPQSVVGFQLAAYDASQTLIIDPVLVYSTYLGGSGNDRIPIIAVDAAGQAYLAGQTSSTNFPTVNPAQPNNVGGPFDLFVAKLNATGTALLYATYIGGSGQEDIGSIAVDRSGSAYVNGRTNSLNFPTLNPFQSRPGGTFDAFVVKLNATGSGLIYSTYLGGSGSDFSIDIKVDAAGNAYLTGNTGVPPGTPNNFPTVNALQPMSGGGGDAFIAKLNPAGSALVYSTYLGGAGNDIGINNFVDAAGNAYVHGQTSSMDFPTTANALQRTFAGGMDAFVVKLNAAGSSLVYSTYLGGSGREIARAIAVDAEGNAYVTGFAGASDFPTRNALQPVYGGGTFDAFVAKLNAGGTALIFSTFLGGNAQDAGEGLGLDAAGNVYVAGFTASTNFPTVNALQPTYGGPPGGGMIGGDGWVAKLNSAGSALVYSTYFGGSGEEEIVFIAVDPAGNVYLSGQTSSTDYPTRNPMQPMYGGGPADVFVAKISEMVASSDPHFVPVGDHEQSHTLGGRTMRPSR